MAFFTIQDLNNYIRDTRLQQIIDSDVTIVEDASATAETTIRDSLFARYDVDSIFASVGAARPLQVIWWMQCIVGYFVYQRVPDRQIPDRILQNYKETKETLIAIDRGRQSTALPLRTDLPDAEGGSPAHRFRWGSQTPRSH